MLSSTNPNRAMRTILIGLAALIMLLPGCAGPWGTLPDPSVQYPIAGLPPPPYAVRQERLDRPDPEADPAAARGFTGEAPPAFAGTDPSYGSEQSAEQEILPPPPTFNSLADCERAYGPGQCRTGDEIFSRNMPVGTPLPAPIAQSYMPYAYGSMTGALSYGYLAPPGAYVPGIPYHQYVSPLVISRYQVITPVVIQRYRAVPLYVREAQIRRGPVIHQHDRRPYPPSSRPPAPNLPYPRPAVTPRAVAAPVAPPPAAPRATPRPAPSEAPAAPAAARPRPWAGPPGPVGPPGPSVERPGPTPLTGTIRPSGPREREARPSSPPPRVAAPAGPAGAGAQSAASPPPDRRTPPRDPKRKDDPRER